MRDRGGEPDELFDRDGKLAEVGEQRVELVRVVEQGHDAG
jgi:hypothetical protein